MRLSTMLLGLLAGVLHAAAARAGVELDQHQPFFNTGTNLVIGDFGEQKLAQTFKPSQDGRLHRVDLIVECWADSTGLFTVEIQGVGADGKPDGVVLASVAQPSSELFDEARELDEFIFPGPELVADRPYAIVLRADPKSHCTTPQGGGPFGDPYSRGQPWYDVRPNPPGWLALGPGLDLHFYTYVDVPESDGPLLCDFDTAQGVPNDWLPNNVPLCACARDDVLLVNRCWFVFPDAMIWRELRWKDEIGEAMWNIVPIRPGLKRFEIREHGLDGNLEVAPLVIDQPLQPGKATRFTVPLQGYAGRSEVKLRFQRDAAAQPAELRFEAAIGHDKPD